FPLISSCFPGVFAGSPRFIQAATPPRFCSRPGSCSAGNRLTNNFIFFLIPIPILRLTLKRATTVYLMLALLAAGSFSLATALQPRIPRWTQRDQDSVLKVLLGDGRRLFAN